MIQSFFFCYFVDIVLILGVAKTRFVDNAHTKNTVKLGFVLNQSKNRFPRMKPSTWFRWNEEELAWNKKFLGDDATEDNIIKFVVVYFQQSNSKIIYVQSNGTCLWTSTRRRICTSKCSLKSKIIKRKTYSRMARAFFAFCKNFRCVPHNCSSTNYHF